MKENTAEQLRKLPSEPPRNAVPDILQILTEKGEKLYLPDLDYYERKLQLGPYPPEIKASCREKIRQLRLRMQSAAAASHEKSRKQDTPDKPAAAVSIPNSVPGSSETPEKLAQRVHTDLCLMRTLENYKSDFKSYLHQTPAIDEAFLSKNLSLFKEWEIGVLLTEKSFSEIFLDQFFDSLDPEKIARCQLFSEGFFMKHFDRLDPRLVLEKGINPWRKKENRSKQLDVFLRLKGIKI